MPKATQPPVSGTTHSLPFEKLAPAEFERLCLWLVTREGYERAEHLGEAGNDQGRDVLAWRGDRRVAFQCKRTEKFTAATGEAEIAKLRGLPTDEQPHDVVFVASRTVSATARQTIRKAWGDEESCQFWVGNELDERVKRYADIVREFFQLPTARPAGKPILGLPYPSLGDLFIGRDAALAALRERLLAAPRQATAIAGKAVHGLGGVGKTRLAVEYARRFASDYTALLFAIAGSPAALQRNLADLARGLDLPEKEALEEPIRAAAVVAWLAANPGWLLILDNVDDDTALEAADQLTASLQGGHVLLTGRVARWPNEIEEIPLDVLTETASVDFLLARTDGKRRKSATDPDDARAIARDLGYLPLALEQAGAYLREYGLTFAGYRHEWESRREAVLAWFDPNASHYPASVAVTWQTSVDRLSTPARRLLERLAWLGPEPIPESLLDVPVPQGTQPATAQDAKNALAELIRASLATREAEAPAFTVHRLVQDVTRLGQTKRSEGAALEEALGWVNAAFVGQAQDVRSWPVLEPLASHARAVAGFADAAGIAEPTARLMNQVAILLQTKALAREAEPLMRRALAIGEAGFGTDHPKVAIRLNNLAQLLQDTNRLVEAEPLMERVVTILEHSFGENHPRVATALNNLAQLLQDTNRLDEAEPLMRRALAIGEATFGTDHPKVAIRLSNLARLLHDTNRLGEAEPLMRRALAIAEASFGTEHPEVATDLNNLAMLLQVTNRLDEAEPLMERVVTIFEHSFGENHPNVAAALNNLAQLLQATNRLDEAEPLMRRVVAIFLDFTRRTGHEHPHLQAAFANFAGLLASMGRTEAEIQAEVEALRRSAE